MPDTKFRLDPTQAKYVEPRREPKEAGRAAQPISPDDLFRLQGVDRRGMPFDIVLSRTEAEEEFLGAISNAVDFNDVVPWVDKPEATDDPDELAT